MVEEENKDKKIEQLLNDISMLEVYVDDFRKLFSFIPFPICFANPQGIILEVNPSFTEITEYTETEIIGMKIFDFFSDEKKESIKTTLQEKTIKNLEVFLRTKNNDQIPILAFIRKNIDESQSSIGGIFFSFYDLREIKRKEHKLEQKIKEINKINQLMQGREIKMVELKNKIKELEEKLKNN